jgi:hypothetical protein
MALTKITAAIIEDGAITASALSDNSIGITQLNVSDGTSGQFLKTDGSGNLSFASVPAGYTDSDVDTKLAAGVGNILTTGYIAGPATFTIDPAAVGDNTGTLVVAGNLQVDGTTTTINSTTMTVDDLNITLASGAANAAAANGAGITVDGASATITYDATNDEWDFNKDITTTGYIGAGTSNPANLLHLESSGSDFATIRLNAPSNTTPGQFLLRAHDGVFDIRNANNSTTDLTIDASGNVGIGTTSPSQKLNVNSGTTTTVAHFQSALGGAGNVALVKVTASGNSSDGFRIIQCGSTSSVEGGANATTLENTESAPLIFGTSGTERMRIDTNGTITQTTSSASPVSANFITGNSNCDLTMQSANTSSLTRLRNGTNDFQVHTNGSERMRIDSSGNVGIGTDNPAQPLSVMKNSNTGNTTPIAVFDTEVAGDYGIVEINSGADNNYRPSTLRFKEGGNLKWEIGGTYQLADDSFGIRTTASDYKMVIQANGNVGIGTSDPKSTLQIEGGRMGIISTDSSWEQLRIANPNVAEAGIAIMNGATNTEFLADDTPSFSNGFTLAINPYGCGTDTLGIAHGNLGDSIWHIDGSGNFGYGPNTENPVSYYEISKTRPNVNAPSDYELKMSLNTYGYVGSGYKLGMLQFLGGDTAGAQDNFYAGIGSTALDGVNNSEEGSLDFHVYNGVSSSETLAVQIIGKAGTPLAGAGQVAKSTLFRYQGIAIDRVWANYPGISVLNSSDAGTNQGEFRFHGTNSASASYPAASGSDFSVDVRADGSFISTSDRRAKINITTIDNALSKVNQLTGKRFQRINRENQPQEHLSKNGYKFGFIAQEIEDIIPEAVKYHANEDDGTENWNSSYAMDYGSVVALLVNAIKEQQVLIEAQATTITDLTTRIETLEG